MNQSVTTTDRIGNFQYAAEWLLALCGFIHPPLLAVVTWLVWEHVLQLPFTANLEASTLFVYGFFGMVAWLCAIMEDSEEWEIAFYNGMEKEYKDENKTIKIGAVVSLLGYITAIVIMVVY